MRCVADCERLGDRALRFARPPVAPRALVDAIRAWPGVVDVVVARHDVAVYFAGTPVIDLARLAALAALPATATAPRTLELPCVYDGEDLAELARATGLDVARVHAVATYTVETMGFAPGFAYLVGLEPALAAIPRRATPRTRIPAGSIGIAGGYTGVYPFDSPGGWHVIGRVTGTRMFGPDGPLLALGDRVRFVP